MVLCLGLRASSLGVLQALESPKRQLPAIDVNPSRPFPVPLVPVAALGVTRLAGSSVARLLLSGSEAQVSNCVIGGIAITVINLFIGGEGAVNPEPRQAVGFVIAAVYRDLDVAMGVEAAGSLVA